METAERFLANAEATFGDLARQPRIGALRIPFESLQPTDYRIVLLRGVMQVSDSPGDGLSSE